MSSNKLINEWNFTSKTIFRSYIFSKFNWRIVRPQNQPIVTFGCVKQKRKGNEREKRKRTRWESVVGVLVHLSSLDASCVELAAAVRKRDTERVTFDASRKLDDVDGCSASHFVGHVHSICLWRCPLLSQWHSAQSDQLRSGARMGTDRRVPFASVS